MVAFPSFPHKGSWIFDLLILAGVSHKTGHPTFWLSVTSLVRCVCR